MAIHPWAHYLERRGFDAVHPALVAGVTRSTPGVQRAATCMDEAFAALSAEPARGDARWPELHISGRPGRVPPADHNPITR
jgi:hypothetical protein